MKRIRRTISSIKGRKVSPLRTVAVHGEKRVRHLSDSQVKIRMERINADFRRAFALIQKYPNTVTFFGSATLPQSSPYCVQARALARKLVEELDATIVSGAGPGIMEAANRGARDAKADSVGYAIQLPREQEVNRYVTHHADFYYFFSRKVALTFTARAYIYFPGGYGTLDELFEILTLKETGKIPPLPIILVGEDYWRPLVKFLEETVYAKIGAISKSDTGLFALTDDFDEVVKIIRKSERAKIK